MIGTTPKKILSNYNGQPCYDYNTVISQNINALSGCSGCDGCIGAANTDTMQDNIPPCSQLRNAVLSPVTAKFDPMQWLKDNPYLAGGAVIAAYFLFIKK